MAQEINCPEVQEKIGEHKVWIETLREDVRDMKEDISHTKKLIYRINWQLLGWGITIVLAVLFTTEINTPELIAKLFQFYLP